MKPAICEKCGKRLEGQVPEHATNIVCFKCDKEKDNGSETTP